MKAELDETSRKKLTEYRLERSCQTLKEVDYLIDGGFYSAAISRLYYACYYAVVALLVANRMETMTHAGVKSMFSLNFVKTNLIERQVAKTFFQLFDLRHNNDYEDYCFCDKETIEEIRPKAEVFISEVVRLIPS